MATEHVGRTDFLMQEVDRLQERAFDDAAIVTHILQNGYWRFVELAKVVIESHRDLIDREPPSDGNYPTSLLMALWMVGVDTKKDIRKALKAEGGKRVNMDGLGD